MVDFLKWIFAIILVALLLWFLWWLFHQRPNRTNNHSVAESGTPPVNTNPAQPSVAEIAALTSLVNAVGTGGGGSVAMNGLSIQINGVQAPLIHIENTGNASKSGDVYLNIGDNIENPVKEEQKSS